MRLKMTLDKSVKPSIIVTEMSHGEGDAWSPFATCEEPKFNQKLNEKLLYTSAVALPPAIRYLSPDHSVILFERPPTFVSYQYTKEMQANIPADAKSRVILRLPIPWQRYVLLLSKTNTIANVFMFFAQNQITDLDQDVLCVAPVLNFYKKGRLCPASYTKMPEYEHSIHGAIDAAYEMIWQSGFNWDTVHALEQLQNMPKEMNPLVKFGNKYEKMFGFWANQTLDEVVSWHWPVSYNSCNQLMHSPDLFHDYAGKADDMVVNFALSAQSARS